MCCFCTRLPYWVVVCWYGLDVLFVHQGNVFIGLSECCVGECFADIEAGSCLSVDVVCIWFESHSPVLCHSECGGRGGVVYSCVVECYCVVC